MSTIACACGRTFEPSPSRSVGTWRVGVKRIALYNCDCRSSCGVELPDDPSVCVDCGDPIHGVKVIAIGYGVMHDWCAEQVLGDKREAYALFPRNRRPPRRAA